MTDISMGRKLLVLHCILRTLKNSIKIIGGIELKIWDDRMILAEEVIGMLDFTKFHFKNKPCRKW